MGVPRKVFRIEEMAAGRIEPQLESMPSHYAEIAQELTALHTALAASPSWRSAGAAASQRAEIDRLTSELRLIKATIGGTGREGDEAGSSRSQVAQTTRINSELDAVVKGSEQATQKILAAAEYIDQAANNLSAALKGAIERGLAQDILDRVIQIFEACNFQDLTAQRVTKVTAALARIEQQIARVLEEVARNSAPEMHGPRLEGDRGHVTQSDVDAIFARESGRVGR